jgi:hypothetical protein
MQMSMPPNASTALGARQGCGRHVGEVLGGEARGERGSDVVRVDGGAVRVEGADRGRTPVLAKRLVDRLEDARDRGGAVEEEDAFDDGGVGRAALRHAR